MSGAAHVWRSLVDVWETDEHGRSVEEGPERELGGRGLGCREEAPVNRWRQTL